MKTDQTQRQDKLNNFSIGSPIDFPRVENNHGGKSVFISMFGNFLDIFNEYLVELTSTLANENERDKINAKIVAIKDVAEYLGASRIFYQCHFMMQCN